MKGEPPIRRRSDGSVAGGSHRYYFRGWHVLSVRADQLETFDEVVDALIRVDADLTTVAHRIENGWEDTDHSGTQRCRYPGLAECESLKRARDLAVERCDAARSVYQSVLDEIAATEPMDREALVPSLVKRKEQAEAAASEMQSHQRHYDWASEYLEDELWAQQRMRELRAALLERLQSLGSTEPAEQVTGGT